ncbi:Uncharacterized protein FWK35_00021805 [Aphis craccivora]|uniref:Uncharacterized protein n=1 Tax=Aphis craccivora TaxID=307492 RepID=A0A6G0YEP3_APHCR|nr:Uncharacterized protein FWK35_00021805 [Aphis craccivora]
MILHSERNDNCIDFTMMCFFHYSITRRNNAPISNFGDGLKCKSEYPWCVVEVKSKHFPTVFKKIKKNKKKMTEKREFLRETSFRPNRFFFWLPLIFSKSVKNAKIRIISRRYLRISALRVENLIQELKFWCIQAIKT